MSGGAGPLLVPILTAALVALVLIPIARRIAFSTGFIDLPRSDRFHVRAVPLLGGPACLLAIAAGTVAAAATAGWSMRGQILPVAVGAAGLCLLGLIDDRRPIPPLPKALAEGACLAAALALLRGQPSFAIPAPAVFLWICWMLAVNAWNYLDHADGIFATAAVFAAGVLTVAASTGAAVDPWTRALGGAVGGALVAFLIHNRPPARIFLGDAGSLPIGFLVVLVATRLLQSGSRSAPAAVAASLAVPIVDLALVTTVRLRGRRNPFVGGREHTGHRLIRRFGARGALVLVACLCSVVAGIALLLAPRKPVAALLAILAIGLAAGSALGRMPVPASVERPLTQKVQIGGPPSV